MSLILALVLLAQATPALPDVAPAAQAARDDSNVHHKPLEKAFRGQTIHIQATVKGQTKMLTPLVFVRETGKERFHGYPLVPRGKDQYSARLPASFTRGASFEYFVEVRLDGGQLRSFGSAENPFVVPIVEPKVVPASLSVRSDDGAVVSVDGKEVGKAPVTVEVAGGKHTVAVASEDGRGAEQQVELANGQKKQVFIPLPRAGGPGTLSLVSEPPGARVTLDDKDLGATPYTGEIVAGDHTIVVEREGYVRQERQATFRAGHDVELSFALVPLPKDPALAIDSAPDGASVFIDGREQKGLTPWVGPLKAGRHQVVLKKQGRREVASDFDMPEGRDLSLRLDLPPPAANSAPRLSVTSKPDGATVLVDGEEVGETPWIGTVKPGTRKLTVKLEGHTPEVREVHASPNREMEVAVALQHVPGPATVTVDTEPAGASIAVDGKNSGVSPVKLTLEPGDHDIEASKNGFKGVGQKISVENGQSMSMRLALAPAGKIPEPIIAVATDPKGARLSIDGKFVGETPFKVKSHPGVHEIKVAMEGFITRSAKITLPENRDFELRVAVSLKRVRGGEERRTGADPKAVARAQLKRAQSCYKQGDYACAQKYYQAVYDFKPVPDLLFNIAQVRRKKGEYKEAANAYRAYLRDKPDGQLAVQAAALAKRCDEIANGGEKTIVEDDTTPPVIVHTPPAKAFRGQSLKLVATITDDKTGVFNPQACWRNMYATEYECAPLQLVGKDEYAAEVPARAVADGFAYFLEAYDNASNGPARSGAPEVPQSVSVDDAPPEVAATNAALPVVQLAAPPPVALASQAPVVISSVGSGADYGPAARWSFLLHAGGELAAERYTDSVVLGRIGLEATRRVGDTQAVLLQLDARTGPQPYRNTQPVPGQPKPADSLTEQRYSARLAYGYDVASILRSDRFSLMAMALAEYQHWQNAVYPANFFGLGAHLQARVQLPEPFALVGGAGWTWNVARNTNDDAVGTPRSDLALRSGVELALSQRYSLELTYRGDLLAFANDYRLTNGLSVGFGTTF